MSNRQKTVEAQYEAAGVLKQSISRARMTRGASIRGGWSGSHGHNDSEAVKSAKTSRFRSPWIPAE